MKKRHLGFKSLYVKWTALFLGLWWGLNFIIIGVMVSVITVERIKVLYPVVREVGGTYYNFIRNSLLAFAVSLILGSIIIILAVRSIVKPVREIAHAAEKVASGDFDATVEVTRNDELGLLANDFNTMTKELKSIDAQRSQFVSSVSHEFRTPITSIKGYAELLHHDATQKNKISDEKKQQYCDIITSESTRLITLSSDLLRLSELDSKVIRHTSTFSMDEQIRKVVLLLEPQWSAKNLSFDLDLQEIEYHGDKDLLEQVWINLIQNAIKFSHTDCTIAVLLHNQEDCFRFEITDYGIGIPFEDQAHIFDSFYMSKKSRESGGNGLGLAIVKRIVEIAGGKISVRSEPNKGTAFEIELPKSTHNIS